jgi:cytochrome c556
VNPAFRSRSLIAIKFALAASLPLLPLSVVRGEVEDHVLARQLIMQALEDDADALGNIAAGIAPPTNLAEHARNLAQHAKESYESFKANSPGGSAKPEIWSSWPDYSKRMELFVVNAEKMAKVAETGNVGAVTELLVEAMPCKGCHDVYRTKKTS